MYANFAGRDASRGMAKQSFDDGEILVLVQHSCKLIRHPEVLTAIDQPLDKLEDLTSSEMYARSLLSFAPCSIPRS
jgi:membrane-associated progesterone receptor component